MGLSTTDPGATLVVAEAVPVNADAADAPIAVAVAAQPAVAPTPQFMEDELQALTREMRKRCGSTYEGTGWLYCFKIRDRLDLLPFSNGRGENGEFPRQSDMQVSCCGCIPLTSIQSTGAFSTDGTTGSFVASDGGTSTATLASLDIGHKTSASWSMVTCKNGVVLFEGIATIDGRTDTGTLSGRAINPENGSSTTININYTKK